MKGDGFAFGGGVAGCVEDLDDGDIGVEAVEIVMRIELLADYCGEVVERGVLGRG